jgi:hypothetical protein
VSRSSSSERRRWIGGSPDRVRAIRRRRRVQAPGSRRRGRRQGRSRAADRQSELRSTLPGGAQSSPLLPDTPASSRPPVGACRESRGGDRRSPGAGLVYEPHLVGRAKDAAEALGDFQGYTLPSGGGTCPLKHRIQLNTSVGNLRDKNFVADQPCSLRNDPGTTAVGKRLGQRPRAASLPGFAAGGALSNGSFCSGRRARPSVGQRSARPRGGQRDACAAGYERKKTATLRGSGLSVAPSADHASETRP